MPFGTLVLALGAVKHYVGREEWAEHAVGLKTIDGATKYVVARYSPSRPWSANWIQNAENACFPFW